jgi:hypothetical protein
MAFNIKVVAFVLETKRWNWDRIEPRSEVQNEVTGRIIRKVSSLGIPTQSD